MKTIHLVSHTHWDREWDHSFQETRFHLIHMMDHLLGLLSSDPSYHCFMLDGQTIILDDYLQVRPERTDILKKFIQSGRLVIGPWYILSDQFLVSPEATVRNLMEGQRTARSFGETMSVGYVPDPFGQIGQLPQILLGFGIENACIWRGLAEEPCEFWWSGPDGSRVLTSYLRESYNNAANLPMGNSAEFINEIKRLASNLEPFCKSDQILLMQGGDHTEPSALTSHFIEHSTGRVKGYQLVHSTLANYFKTVRSTLEDDLRIPVISGELRSSKRAPILPGVLSARMWIKQRNHACENLLEHWVEPFSAWVQASGPQDTQARLFFDDYQGLTRYAWKLLMECHPHDSICGTSIDQVHEEMRPRFDQVEQIGEAITTQSLSVITSQIDTRYPGPNGGDLLPIVITVFNPSAFKRTDRVSFDFDWPASVSSIQIIDENNQVIHHQFEGDDGQELLNASFNRRDLLKAVELVGNGQIAGYTFKESEISINEKKEVIIHAVMVTHSGEPDLEGFEDARRKVGAFLEDPQIDRYVIHASAAPSGALTFIAADVPGLGYRSYWVRPVYAKEPSPTGAAALMLLAQQARQNVSGFLNQINPLSKPADTTPHPHARHQIENEYLSVHVEPQDGTLTLIDKRFGLKYEGLNCFVDGGDCGDVYNYCPPQQDSFISPELVSVHVENGVVKSCLDIHYMLTIPAGLQTDRKSRSPKTVKIPIHSHAVLYHQSTRLEIRTTLNNTAHDHRLRVHFTAPINASVAQYGGHFEIVQRPIGYPRFDQSWAEQPRPEVPQRLFTTLSDGAYGLTLASRGLPEIEARTVDERNSELCLTLLRCVGWLSRDDLTTRKGHAGPSITTPGAQDTGRAVFDYAVIPHNSGWQNGILQAEAFDLPLRASLTSLHDGANPPTASLIEVHGQFSLTCVKNAENVRGLLVRGFRRSYGGEITIRCNLPLANCTQVRLDESQLQPLAVGPDGFYRLKARPFEIVSLLFY